MSYQNFNIHNILNFKIGGTNKGYVKYLSQYFSYFKTDVSVDPELNIEIRDFVPERDEYYIVNRKYYIKKNYITFSDRYKVVTWDVCLKDIEREKVFLILNASYLGKVLIVDYLIEPLIGFELARKGFLMLHASGAAINGKGIIFPACMGVGKTSTILYLAERGNFMANEKIILSKNGDLYSFPTSVHLYNYNLESCPQLSRKMHFEERIKLKMKYLLYLVSHKYASFPLEVPPIRFWKIEDKSPLYYVILLTKTNRKDIKIIENVDIERIIERIIIINKFDMKYFFEILQAYSYIYPGSSVNPENYWKSFRNNLLAALKKAFCYEIEIPLRYDDRVFNHIYNIIKTF